MGMLSKSKPVPGRDRGPRQFCRKANHRARALSSGRSEAASLPRRRLGGAQYRHRVFGLLELLRGSGGGPVQTGSREGLLNGTTISSAQITGDRRFVDLLLQKPGLIVAENDMKWQAMNKGARGTTTTSLRHRRLRPGERSRAARSYLPWYHPTTEWYFDLPSRREQERAVVKPIEQLARRYRGRA
jgi:hypothetical protein